MLILKAVSRDLSQLELMLKAVSRDLSHVMELMLKAESVEILAML